MAKNKGKKKAKSKEDYNFEVAGPLAGDVGADKNKYGKGK